MTDAQILEALAIIFETHLDAEYWQTLAETRKAAAAKTATKAKEEMKTAGRRNAILGKPDKELVKYYLDSTYEQVAMRTTKMTFDHIRQLRELAAETFKTASLTGASLREISSQMLDKATQIPGFQFIDNANHKWKDETYFRMLARTETMHAALASYDAAVAEDGFDVVELDYSGESCPECEKWEGKLFSLTGATKGLPTKQDLIDDGVFHPNCTHSYSVVDDLELAERGLDFRQPQPKDDDEPEDKEPEIAEPEKKSKEPPAKPFEWPADPEKLKVVKRLGGSTGAELVEDTRGNRYVRKHGGHAGGDAGAHLRNECAADHFYRAMGIDVPDLKLYETEDGPVKLSRFIDGGQSLGDWWEKASAAEREEMLGKLRPGFDIDVLTGNWDVVGMSADNILIDKYGKPWRIDNGGTFDFRAQGARKQKEQWQDGFVDDVWTMRRSSNNQPYFGQTDTLDLCQTIAGRNYKTALETLPEADRKVIEKRLYEIRQLAERGTPFRDDAKYTPQAIDTVLKSSHDLSKEGLRERLAAFKVQLGPDHLPTDYGLLRSPRTDASQAAPLTAAEKNKDLQAKVLAAAKTINVHNAPGKDKQPNMTTIKAASALKPELEELIKRGNIDATHYLDAITQIEKAAKNGNTIPMIDTSKPVWHKDPARPKVKAAADTRSFSMQVWEYINGQTTEYQGHSIPLDPNFIAIAQRKQGSDSYLDEACRVKICRLNAKGLTVDTADGKYYLGDGDRRQKENIKEAAKHYRDNPEELARDTETYLRYQGAMQLLLENVEMPYIDRASRTILLGRTENSTVVPNKKPWTEATHLRGVNESHGMFRTVTVAGSRLTVARVPFDRISGCFMAERVTDGRVTSETGFLGDNENEMTADTSGLRILYCGTVHSRMDLSPFFDKFLEWERNGYKMP